MQSSSEHDRPRLRPGTREDAAAMAALHARCWRDVFGRVVTREAADRVPAQNFERFSSWFVADSGFAVTVAEIDGELAGYTAVSGHQLVHLFVDPDRSRQGLGRRLLADAETRIAGGGHPVAELHTRAGNEPAIALYRTAGWELTDELVPSDDHGVTVDEHVMTKQLRAD